MELFQDELRRQADAIIDTRLGSIERTLERLEGIFERVIRNEEKLLAHLENDKTAQERMDRIDAHLVATDKRVDDLEKTGILTNAEVGGWVKLRSAFYLAIATGIGAWVWSHLSGKS